MNRGNTLTTWCRWPEVAGPEPLGREHFGPNSPEATQKYSLGDVVNTLIRTRRGETILVSTTPTRRGRTAARSCCRAPGVVQKYPDPRGCTSQAEQGTTPGRSSEIRRPEYEHPDRRSLEEQSKGAGHGGMDYIEDFRLVSASRRHAARHGRVRRREPSSVSELSERTIAGRKPVDGIDFTRGAWEKRPPLGIVNATA